MKRLQKDVYKRQGEDSALLLSNPDRGLRMEVYLDVATGESLFEHAGEDAVKQLYDETVSYTHLDVYKRQITMCCWS